MCLSPRLLWLFQAFRREGTLTGLVASAEDMLSSILYALLQTVSCLRCSTEALPLSYFAFSLSMMMGSSSFICEPKPLADRDVLSPLRASLSQVRRATCRHVPFKRSIGAQSPVLGREGKKASAGPIIIQTSRDPTFFVPSKFAQTWQSGKAGKASMRQRAHRAQAHKIWFQRCTASF